MNCSNIFASAALAAPGSIASARQGQGRRSKCRSLPPCGARSIPPMWSAHHTPHVERAPYPPVERESEKGSHPTEYKEKKGAVNMASGALIRAPPPPYGARSIPPCGARSIPPLWSAPENRPIPPNTRETRVTWIWPVELKPFWPILTHIDSMLGHFNPILTHFGPLRRIVRHFGAPSRPFGPF